ncbi:aminopeptidase N [Pokkaliibacter plantistimulans]|uniref:Aminopeptidase N n=1 Tax=Pokkaliibacter plantistimulans TaxID=1635171 RepID=A0ABX5M0T7_9GAMM|nr:aminopeptidase N [Pokkaliibacter plantistimulans]PXF31343.1 aminopeptidase N [Pokkaliibacter plantistimulans]
MSQDNAKTVYLKDYQPPAFSVESVELTFSLFEEQCQVRSNLHIKRQHPGQLVLNGGQHAEVLRVEVNGELLHESGYRVSGEDWVIEAVPDEATLTVLTQLQPQNNTTLEGLYKSSSMYCTQCEAEGFRQITLYPDRPDVMSVFTTRIEADKALYPVLLSNGNLVEQGELENGRHFAVWHDPFRKPSYLFALVAGDLQHIEDSFTTMSGRAVTLRLYTEARNISKTEFAMGALQRSMKWDEEAYGREYDLDLFNIVAVDDFNMGAMENKSLNIFNSSCVLARADTTTDAGFQRIEAIVAHEYFHNWSGNRVTCRDWFQLSLKEGFTVFRDSQFSSDMGSAAVKRIEDVTLLRTAQFAEDAGPTSHPVRPDNYMEISNFYTLTIYEKGAEVVRMIHTLLGAELFRQGSDLYFERFDGQAVTCDDFVRCMEEVSGRDLTQFMRWYTQAGTPRLQVTDEYDAATGTYYLDVRQSCPATPGQEQKLPFHIPLAVGLLYPDGTEHHLQGDSTLVLDVTEAEQRFMFKGITQRPIPSLLRGFSAPVKLDYPYSREELSFLMSHDTDGFNRWEAGQRLAMAILQEQIGAIQAGEELEVDPALIAAFERVLDDTDLDYAVAAKVLTLPSEAYLAENAQVIDVEAIHQARRRVRKVLADALCARFRERYHATEPDGVYAFHGSSIGQRALNNLCLGYLLATEREEALELVRQQYAEADNMTDSMGALAAVVHSPFTTVADELLEQFYGRWSEDALVVNQWLSLQASVAGEGTLAKVQSLLQHAAFDWRNPNKVRSVLGAYGQSSVGFHRADGAGYEFLADQVIHLDPMNPQLASRMVTPLTRWRRYPAARQAQMRAALERIAAQPLSKDVYEIVSKSLA